MPSNRFICFPPYLYSNVFSAVDNRSNYLMGLICLLSPYVYVLLHETSYDFNKMKVWAVFVWTGPIRALLFTRC